MGKGVITALMGLFVFVAFGLTGCGGGNGDGDGTANNKQTPADTSVNLVPFKSVYEGTSAGAQVSFPALTGSDSRGRTWSGSFTMIADGATTLEAQNVTQRRSLVTLQLKGGSPFTSTLTAYFNASNEVPYQATSITGVTYTATSAVAIPSTARIGEFGTLGTLEGSDGTTITGSWSLGAAPDGVPILTISTVTEAGGTTTAAEAYSFFLDSAGLPARIFVSATMNGITVNLEGSRR